METAYQYHRSRAGRNNAASWWRNACTCANLACSSTNRCTQRSRLSPRGEKRPELLCPARRHTVAERRRPMALVAEIVAPREQPQRKAMQDVLAGKSDGAVNLVRDCSSFRGGFRSADFCRSDFKQDRILETEG